MTRGAGRDAWSQAIAGAVARRRRAGRCVAHDGVVRPRRTRHADLRGDPAARPADRPRAGLPAQPGGAQPTHPGKPHHRPGRRHDRHRALRRRADPREHDRGAQAWPSPPRLRVRGRPEPPGRARRGPRRSPGLRPGRRHQLARPGVRTARDRRPPRRAPQLPQRRAGYPASSRTRRREVAPRPVSSSGPDTAAGSGSSGRRRPARCPARAGFEGIVAEARGRRRRPRRDCRASGGPRRRTT